MHINNIFKNVESVQALYYNVFMLIININYKKKENYDEKN
ncbi:hypothetical protein CNEO_60076 [Clostridium neonatale]|uniref:Uncharacterized protein n=1 Tax=Clostridium neonatale TaxID=137838 RepID=A0AA86MQT2_9CLOT|nr:hypothetical protein CNEO_60076 [Clostridium neonatale]